MKSGKNNIFFIIAVLAVSSLIIFYKFNLIPANLTFDEVEFAKLALSLDHEPYTPYSIKATGHSTLYFYTLLASFKIFGVNNFGLRFPSAVSGVVGTMFFYLIMKMVFKKNHVFAFGLTILFAASRWYFGFARFSFEATFLIMLELISLFFAFKAFQKKTTDNISLAVSGLFAGLAFNSYTPGRFFFIVLIFYIYASSPDIKTFFRKTAYFIIPLIIITAPLVTYLIGNQDNRVDKLFFWKNHEMTVLEKAEGTLNNIITISAMFFIKGDMSGKHNYPGKAALNPLIGLLFACGLFIFFRNGKNTVSKTFFLYLFISLLPSIMIYPWENPNMLRTATSVPAVIYFSGTALQMLVRLFGKSKLTVTAIVAIIAISSFYELRTYFHYQSKIFPQAFETKPSLEKSLKYTNFKYGK